MFREIGAGGGEEGREKVDPHRIPVLLAGPVHDGASHARIPRRRHGVAGAMRESRIVQVAVGVRERGRGRRKVRHPARSGFISRGY